MSAVTNTIPDAGETSSQRISTPARPNPIAAEVRVNASGSRPKDGGTERELFSEDTETVLTFADGAVIRLLATVTPGQLIFLTNLVTGQEVVCEVLRKRLLRPAGCYVELQFTEQKKGFWDPPQGVAAQTADRMRGKAKKAEEGAESETKTAEKGSATGDPSKTSIETLVSEVQELLAKKAAPERKEPPAAGARSTEIPKSDVHGAASASANHPVAEMVPVVQEQGKAARSDSEDKSDDLLPKPELDFSQVPSAPTVKKRDPSLLQKPIPVVGATTQKLTWALLSLALLGVGAHYGHWLDFLMRPNTTAVKPAGPSKATAPSAKAVPKDRVAPSGETEESTATGGAAEKPQATAEKARPENTRSEKAEPTGLLNETAPEPPNEEPAIKASRRGKSETSATVQAELPPSDAEPAGQESLVPAKLLKSVNPVYPPEAMRSFITGDVKAEVEVKATGHAGDVKVLSGPTQLRKAAVDAVKQYEFSPATRGGKTLPSKVVVTVKFWFNP